MARNLELSIGEYYHLYNRGTDKRKVFLENSDRDRFLALLYLCNNTENIHASNHYDSTLMDFLDMDRKETLVDIGGYCLMPNHFHILVKEKIENGISLFMQKLSTAYTMYFNKKNKRTGSLFEGRFKARHLDDDEYLKYFFSYIHLNPVGIIDEGWKDKQLSNIRKAEKFLKEYRYSSYFDYMGSSRKEGKILEKGSFPEYFESATEFDLAIKYWLEYEE